MARPSRIAYPGAFYLYHGETKEKISSKDKGSEKSLFHIASKSASKSSFRKIENKLNLSRMKIPVGFQKLGKRGRFAKVSCGELKRCHGIKKVKIMRR